MTETVSRTKLLLARMALVLLIGFVVLGVALYGVSLDVHLRAWKNILDRPGGPMTFRFLLQPVMATVAALRDGIKDARTGRSPYFWTVLTNPAERAGRLHEGLIATAQLILLGLGMYVIYQIIVLKSFFPSEAVIIALTLTFVPYMLLRGPIARIARWWIGDPTARQVR